MSRYVFKMPDLGEGTVSAEVVEWKVKVGDAVKEDQVIAEVMTDKAAVEIPSPVTGRVLAITGQPGDMVAVGSELIAFDTSAAERNCVCMDRSASFKLSIMRVRDRLSKILGRPTLMPLGIGAVVGGTGVPGGGGCCALAAKQAVSNNTLRTSIELRNIFHPPNRY
jgi:pyruvate/2-oxoglutarate dehydrogenase complex dihydrolipoamide acyltransferase (E2) component